MQYKERFGQKGKEDAAKGGARGKGQENRSITRKDSNLSEEEKKGAGSASASGFPKQKAKGPNRKIIGAKGAAGEEEEGAPSKGKRASGSGAVGEEEGGKGKKPPLYKSGKGEGGVSVGSLAQPVGEEEKGGNWEK